MTVEIEDGNLQIDCTERTWRFMLELEHVSGHSFVAEKLDIDMRDRERSRARFQVEDGRVNRGDGRGDDLV